MEAVETLIEEIHHSITLRYPDQTIERYITGGSIFTTGRERTGKLRSGVLAAILFLIPPAAAIWAGINLFHPDPGSAPGIMVDSRRIITAASHIGKLRRSSTEDLVSLYRKGANSGEYEQALMLYGLLPDSISGNDDILLLRLRCLMNMDSVAMKTLNTTRIKDAEYYLLKGRFLYRRGMFTEAVGSFDSAALFSAQLMDIGAVRRSAIAYRARSLTLIYKRNPGRESLVKAVSGWYDVKKNATDLMDPAFIESASGLTFLIRDAEARKLLVQGDTLRKAMQ